MKVDVTKTVTTKEEISLTVEEIQTAIAEWLRKKRIKVKPEEISIDTSTDDTDVDRTICTGATVWREVTKTSDGKEKKKKVVTVVINGKNVCIPGKKNDKVTYEQIVQAAGMQGNPSMTWKVSDGRGGMLSPGEWQVLSPMTIYNVANTGSA